MQSLLQRVDWWALLWVATVASVTGIAIGAMLGGCLPIGKGAQMPAPCRPFSPDSPLHEPPFVDGIAPAGTVDDTRLVDLRIQLPLREQAMLDRMVDAIYDPNSRIYRQFLTPEDFHAAFHPSADDFGKVARALEGQGLRVVGEPRGALLRVTGTARAAQAALGARLKQVRAPDGRLVVVPTGSMAAQVGSVPIRAVHGLSDGVHKRAPAPKTAARRPGYSPQTLRNAYGVPARAPAGDQVVGVIALDGYRPSDMAAHARAYTLREVPRRHIGINGWTEKITDPDNAIEVTLDLQVIQGVAQMAKEIRVFGAPNTDTAFIDLFTEIANPADGLDLVPVVSCSWGMPETEMGVSDAHALDDVFKQLAVQGVAVFAASGDLGSRDDGVHESVDAPASSPFVAAVGGTSLTANGRGWQAEVAWSGSGGGSSCWWPSPDWQKGLVTRLTGGSAKARAVPDLALHADPVPGHGIIVDGRAMAVGGTSAATPLMAGMWALILQARKDQRLGGLGFPLPSLYRASQLPGTEPLWHDCISGSNTDFQACRGFDLTTGWGSPKYPQLLSAMVKS